MKKIYVVVGSAGEYDEFTQWNLAAFLDKEKALEHAAKATAEALRVIAELRIVQQKVDVEVSKIGHIFPAMKKREKPVDYNERVRQYHVKVREIQDRIEAEADTTNKYDPDPIYDNNINYNVEELDILDA